MGKSGQYDNKERFSELEWQRPDGGGHADPAGCGPSASAVCTLIPSRFSVVEGQATNVPAIKPDELGERAHTAILASTAFCITADACVHRLERSLPEEAFDKRGRSRMIKHEPVVSRQGQPEPAQIREVGKTVV